MSTLPFVSVVMPAHNEEQYISECLHSLKDQDYPADRFEIIVVDNNSTDRTVEIAKSFGVTVLHKESGPVGAVRNHGVAHAQGEVIAFIDSDCVAPNNWITKGVELLATGHHVAYGGRCTLRKNPFWLEQFWLLEGSAPKQPPAELLGCAIFVEKACFEKHGMFDESITSGEDSKLSITIRQAGSSVGFSAALDVAHLGNPISSAAFFKRQVWHSENYLKDLKTSIKDKAFILIVIFYALGIISVLSVFFGTASTFLISFALFLMIPAIFSTRRIIAARYKPANLNSLASIYYLDFLYLVARCTGLTKGFFQNRSQ